MPMNPLPPAGVVRPKPPKAPPVVLVGAGGYRIPPPLPKDLKLLQRPLEKKPHWFKVLCGWLFFIALFTFIGYAVNQGLEDAKVKVEQWRKEANYKKCTGEFNTLSCHERLSKERELKYKEFTRGQ